MTCMLCPLYATLQYWERLYKGTDPHLARTEALERVRVAVKGWVVVVVVVVVSSTGGVV